MKGKAGSLVFNLFVGLIFLAGLGIMLYPRISDWWNTRNMSRNVEAYERSVQDLSEADYNAALEKAREYNRRLRENPDPFSERYRTEGYEDTLDISGSGIMGYVTIEKLHVRLPFYHGTEEAVLQVAIGHIEGTSLPVGDPGEHAALSAHRGVPNAKLFTDLPELVTGDRFTLTVLDRKMTYEVDQILTLLPDDMEALKREEGKDLVTLITCTPYGINSHRLLVRGHRVENDAEEQKGTAFSGTTARQEAGRSYDRYVPFVAGAAVLIFGALMFGPLFRKKK